MSPETTLVIGILIGVAATLLTIGMGRIFELRSEEWEQWKKVQSDSSNPSEKWTKEEVEKQKRRDIAESQSSIRKIP